MQKFLLFFLNRRFAEDAGQQTANTPQNTSLYHSHDHYRLQQVRAVAAPKTTTTTTAAALFRR
jgi:hypothetical protein